MDATNNRCHFAMVQNLSIFMAVSCCLYSSLTTCAVIYSFSLVCFEMRGLSAEQRQQIVYKWCTERGLSLRKIVKMEGVSEKAVRNAIRKFGEDNTSEDKPKTGRKKGPANPQLDKRILKAFEQKKEVSVRDVAKKVGTSKSNVLRAKERLNLRTYKKQKQPKRSPKQEASIRPRVRKLYNTILAGNSNCIIMDDETYVKLDYKSLPGPQYYTVREGQVLNQSETSIEVEKFGKKAMVWQAICSCGKISKPFITTASMNSEIYIKECLQKRLLPMIRSHKDPVVFWPDLASCHYSKSTVEWYTTKNVTFVPKDMNPPNCPQLRPIEEFWALTKAHLRKHVSAAETIQQFEKDWKKVSKLVAKKSVRNLMRNVRKKVRQLVYNG